MRHFQKVVNKHASVSNNQASSERGRHDPDIGKRFVYINILTERKP